jgi:hypothetical protein
MIGLSRFGCSRGSRKEHHRKHAVPTLVRDGCEPVAPSLLRPRPDDAFFDRPLRRPDTLDRSAVPHWLERGYPDGRAAASVVTSARGRRHAHLGQPKEVRKANLAAVRGSVACTTPRSVIEQHIAAPELEPPTRRPG